MSSKFTFEALAIAGLLAISGLPAMAAEMSPASPAPSTAVQSDVKGDVGGKSVTTQTKADAKSADKKDGKNIHSETKMKDGKDQRTELKSKHDQTAKLPGAAPAANANGAAETPVQH